MTYRIELEKINRKYRAFDYNDYVYGVAEIKTFLTECIPTGYKVAKIVKTTKDGRGYDVTSKYM